MGPCYVVLATPTLFGLLRAIAMELRSWAIDLGNMHAARMLGLGCGGLQRPLAGYSVKKAGNEAPRRVHIP
jgi:hypothetical protein